MQLLFLVMMAIQAVADQVSDILALQPSLVPYYSICRSIIAGLLTQITPLSAELSSLLETNYGIYTADKCIDNNTAQTQLPYPWLALDLGRPRKLRRLSFSIEMVAVGMTSGIWRCVYLTPNLALMKGRFLLVETY